MNRYIVPITATTAAVITTSYLVVLDTLAIAAGAFPTLTMFGRLILAWVALCLCRLALDGYQRELTRRREVAQPRNRGTALVGDHQRRTTPASARNPLRSCAICDEWERKESAHTPEASDRPTDRL